MTKTNFNIQFGNATHVGLVRQSNEDYHGSFKVTLGMFFVICDGMGGHAGGAIAAQTCVEGLRLFFERNNSPASIDGLLENAIKFGNSVVYKKARGDRSLKGMGTTIVLLMIDNQGKVYHAHIGDSRIYLLQGGHLKQLTKDHSYVQTLIDGGIINEEQAESHPGRNRILRAVGIANDVEVEINSTPFRLWPSDKILMCSDGLSGMLKSNVITEILSMDSDPQTIANNLIGAALKAGGNDNITVQVIVNAITEPSLTTAADNSQYLKKRKSIVPKIIISIIIVMVVATVSYLFANGKVSM